MRFKKGDKVVPISKNYYGKLGDSVVYKRAKELGQGFLYVIDYKSIEGNIVVRCQSHNDGYGGDYFLESDLIFYVEEDASQKVTQLEREVEALKNVIKILLEVR